MAPAFARSAILVVGSYSDQGRCLALGKRAELWTESDAGDCGDEADAFDLLQALYFLLQRRLLFQDRADGQFELADLPLQQFKSGAIESAYDVVQVLRLLLQEYRALFHQLLTRADQLLQSQLRRSGQRIGRRIYLRTKTRQHLCINGISLGQPAHPASKIAHLPGIDHRERHCALLRYFDQLSLIAAAGFND